MPPEHRRPAETRRAALALLAVVFLVVAIYVIFRLGSQGQILGSVLVLDVEIGGMSAPIAADTLSDLEERLANLPATVTVEGSPTDILPVQTGFDLDETAIVTEAMEIGRSPNPVSNLFWWMSHLFSSEVVAPQAALDPKALEEVLDGLDETVIGEPPFEGSVSLQDGEVVAEYPRPGRRIDRREADRRLVAGFLTLEGAPVDLPVNQEQPTLAPADVDAAVAEAELMLSSPVVLSAENGTSLTFDVDDLQTAFVATIIDEPPAIDLGFDVEVVETRLAEVRPDFELPPVDAHFEIDGYEVVIVPGRNGTLLDAEETADVLADAARTTTRQAELPLQEGAEPETTTDDLEALGIRHLVSQFTTYYDCCAPRVTNIHLIADKVDGVIMTPGQTFSLNDYVGRRTAEEGYLEAGTIVAGEIVDTVGGGVSQFATTFYNAVFWGGYEDLEHDPHSFYFSRYPEGIEATISWPLPDLVFRNDDESGILIRTTYTDTSITVQFYGDNEGRILVGEQSGGDMGVGVVAEGDPGAKEVRGDRSDRYDFRDPPEPLYRPNPDLDVDESDTVQEADEGWSVLVTRTITINGEVVTQEWPVRYLPQQEIIEVHPCKVPGTDQTCPTTTTATTTTTPTTTTGTTPPTTPPTTQPPPTAPPTTGG